MTTCTTPAKVRYATRAAAEISAARARLRLDTPLTPYECACTWWHLTKHTVEPLPDPADATLLNLERLASIPDIDFREIVAADARSEGDAGIRAALRHRRTLPRWRKHLGQLVAEADRQLRARRGDKSLEAHDWRKRALGHRDRLMLRMNECRRLRSEAHLELMAGQDTRRRTAEAAAAAGATPKEMRRHAGEVAVGRLIAAHGEEFARYLTEEYQTFGLPIPDRITKWTRQDQPAA